MTQVSCMGGWNCPLRDKCALHLNPTKISVKRLCEPGMDDAFWPIRLVHAEHRRTEGWVEAPIAAQVA